VLETLNVTCLIGTHFCYVTCIELSDYHATKNLNACSIIMTSKRQLLAQKHVLQR